MLAQTSTQSWRPVVATALILIVTSPGCFNSCPLQRPSMNTTRCFPGRCQFTSADHTFLLHRLRPTGTQAQRGVVDGSHTFIHLIDAGVEDVMPLNWLPSNVQLVSNSGVHAEKAREFAIMSLLCTQRTPAGNNVEPASGKLGAGFHATHSRQIPAGCRAW
jgi:hypothetical protein